MTTRLITEAEYQRLRSLADATRHYCQLHNDEDMPDAEWEPAIKRAFDEMDSAADRVNL